MRITLLGTGTPQPDLQRMPSACVIHTPLGPWLLDCGDGALWQLMRAGIEPQDVQHLIFTHLHADHTLGLLPFVMGRRQLGRRPIRAWGPSRAQRLHQLLRDFYADDGGADSGMSEIVLSEYGGGTIFEGQGLVVDALPVRHSTETYALRFRADGQTIVHSSDTAYHEPLIEFARGADVLIHSAMAVGAMRDLWGSRWDDIHAIMATPAEAGRVARLAHVTKLVLVHLPEQVDARVIEDECRSEFGGDITVGADLMNLP